MPVPAHICYTCKRIVTRGIFKYGRNRHRTATIFVCFDCDGGQKMTDETPAPITPTVITVPAAAEPAAAATDEIELSTSTFTIREFLVLESLLKDRIAQPIHINTTIHVQKVDRIVARKDVLALLNKVKPICDNIRDWVEKSDKAAAAVTPQITTVDNQYNAWSEMGYCGD